jgi:hypothetical protein
MGWILQQLLDPKGNHMVAARSDESVFILKRKL